MMYNRYIPQPDGSYRRRQVPEPNRTPPHKQETPKRPPYPPPEPPCKEPIPPPKPPHRPPETGSPGGFLRQLLPKDFDTGDLIVVLLLLLMAGDCPEDRNNAILTLALYFLM